MSTDLILNLLVAAIFLNSIIGARFDVAERRAKAAEYGAPYVFARLFTVLTSLTLWVILAFVTGQWQFAAFVVIPLLVTIGASAARPGERP